MSKSLLGLILVCMLASCSGSGDTPPPPVTSGSTVPNLVGTDQGDAATAITQAGLTLGKLTVQSSGSVQTGQVVGQSPTAGTSASPGSKVSLTVSGGTQSLVPTVGSTVPANVTASINTTYTVSATAPLGGPLATQSDGSIPVLFGGNGSNDPLLLAVGASNGVLDANTTSIGMVRIALGLVSAGPVSADTLSSLIQGSPNYAALLAAVNASLASGQSPIGSANVVQAVWTVAEDAATSYASSTSRAKRIAEATVPVNLPLPFYLLNSIEAINQVFLNDVPGTASVNVMNQTFITWQLTSNNLFGTQIDSEVAAPLHSTPLQLLGSYTGSASSTTVTGTLPEFNLTLAQSDTTHAQNILLSASQFVFALYAAATNIYPDATAGGCVMAAYAQLKNASLPALLTQPSGASALQYFKDIYQVTDINTIASAIQNCLPNAPPIKKFGSSIFGEIYSALNLAISATSALGGSIETFIHWSDSSSFEVCKVNSVLASCVAALQLTPATAAVAVGASTTLAATAKDSKARPTPIPSNLIWTAGTPSVATVEGGVVTGVSAGTSMITVTDPASQAAASVVVSVNPGTNTSFDYNNTINGTGTEVGATCNAPVNQGGPEQIEAAPKLLRLDLILYSESGTLSGPWYPNSVTESGGSSVGTGTSTYTSTITAGGMITTTESSLTGSGEVTAVQGMETVNLTTGAYIWSRTINITIPGTCPETLVETDNYSGTVPVTVTPN